MTVLSYFLCSCILFLTLLFMFRSQLLFQGNQYWRFQSTSMDSGYPRDISQWRGLPADIDSAFVWSGNGRIYFTKGKVRSDHSKIFSKCQRCCRPSQNTEINDQTECYWPNFLGKITVKYCIHHCPIL